MNSIWVRALVALGILVLAVVAGMATADEATRNDAVVKIIEVA
jgi:hypothetical protein